MFPAALFIAMIAIGTIGLFTVRSTSSMDGLANLKAAYDKKFAAQEQLIDALTREATAAKNLADEREKTLVMYRRFMPPEHKP
jgi:hypothetical protein